jgi:hypothetical protein
MSSMQEWVSKWKVSKQAIWVSFFHYNQGFFISSVNVHDLNVCSKYMEGLST